ncbi:24385_t:CDS:2 [Dentiscutata erythropus]|uniref:24385_t:CDS:1 n=2 Tax=Diversisporales TaxID=214509 RepID=A0A9N9P4W5_9GLOM|nr:24385_t:CDS:2 [Dentiscutata erythropus]
MTPKRTSKDPNTQQSKKSIKSRAPPSRLAKEDIDYIIIGIQKCNKIWKSENPYSYANSIEDVNLPNWYINNSKFEKVNTSPKLTPQIDIPKKPDIVKPDPIEVKKMRKQGEMEQITKNIFRSELSKLMQADD